MVLKGPSRCRKASGAGLCWPGVLLQPPEPRCREGATFKEPGAADKAKETLYMFFTVQGNFIAANFTGK